MNIGQSTIDEGDNPTLGGMVIEIGAIPTSEASDIVYLRHIITQLDLIEFKINTIQKRLDESLWERIKRWLGIH